MLLTLDRGGKLDILRQLRYHEYCCYHQSYYRTVHQEKNSWLNQTHCPILQVNGFAVEVEEFILALISRH